MEFLETEWLRKKEAKCNRGSRSFTENLLPEIQVPAHCKIFSLSSCASNAYLCLGQPYQSTSLELFDGKGRRLAHIARSEIGRKVQSKKP